jgi:hypothetical protein
MQKNVPVTKGPVTGGQKRKATQGKTINAGRRKASNFQSADWYQKALQAFSIRAVAPPLVPNDANPKD